MADPEIDIQVVINRLTTTIAQMTADLAVKDALIEAFRAGAGTDVEGQPLSLVEDELDGA